MSRSNNPGRGAGSARKPLVLTSIGCALLVAMPAPSGASPQETSVQRVERQIEAARSLIRRTTNDAVRAELQQHLALKQRDLENLKRRAELEEKEKHLARRQRRNSLYALNEFLCSIDSESHAAAKESRDAGSDIWTQRKKRAKDEEELKRLQRSDDVNEEKVAALEQEIRNTEERILLHMAKKEAADLKAGLVQEARRIQEKVDSLPAKPAPTIRLLVEKRNYIREEDKQREDLSVRIEGFEARRAEVAASLALSQEKSEHTDSAIDLLQKKRRLDRKDKELKRLLDLADIERDSLSDRVELQQGRLESIEESIASASKLQSLYERELALMLDDHAGLRKRYWLRILVPLTMVAAVLMLQLLVSGVILTWFYDKNHLFVARRLTGYAGLLIVICLLTSFFLEDLKAIATVLGIAGAALVIALQDLCSSFAGWFVIVASRKVRVGDRIEVDGHLGDVVDIQLLRTTMLELNNWLGADEPTGRVIIIPNSFIFKSKVLNSAHVHPYIWSRLDVTVTFETPAQEARDLLQRILEEETQEEFNAASRAGEEMAHKYGVPDTTYKPKLYSVIVDSGVAFSLLYVSHYRRRVAVRNRVNERIVAEFEKNAHINFAYPTQRHIPTAEPGGLHVTVNQPAGDSTTTG